MPVTKHPKVLKYCISANNMFDMGLTLENKI